MVRESLRMDDGGVKPVFLPRFSIAGGRLQQAVMSYYALMRRQTFGQETVPEAETDAALAALREAYPARVAALAKSLRKAGLRAYITVNQYNLRDLLMIHACRNLGIRTFQQEHHAMQFCRVPFDTEHPKYRFSLVGEYGFWNRTEQLFHEKVYRYDSPLYRPVQGAAGYRIIPGRSDSFPCWHGRYPDRPIRRSCDRSDRSARPGC